MSKSLVIVESPAKAKTINKYLGSQYVVKSSVGHICDLPTSGSSTGEKAKPVSIKGLSTEEKAKIKAEKDRAALVKRMGIDPKKALSHDEPSPSSVNLESLSGLTK